MLPLLPIASLWPLAPLEKDLEGDLAEGVPSGSFDDATDTIIWYGSIPGQFACRTSSLAKALLPSISRPHQFSTCCLYIKCMAPRHMMTWRHCPFDCQCDSDFLAFSWIFYGKDRRRRPNFSSLPSLPPGKTIWSTTVYIGFLLMDCFLRNSRHADHVMKSLQPMDNLLKQTYRWSLPLLHLQVTSSILRTLLWGSVIATALSAHGIFYFKNNLCSTLNFCSH